MNKRIADMTSEERADAVSRGVLEVKACKMLEKAREHGEKAFEHGG